jgi:hypothetical protein
MLAEVAFEPIDGRERRRSGVTKRAKTQRPRNYALLALRIPIGAQESYTTIGDSRAISARWGIFASFEMLSVSLAGSPTFLGFECAVVLHMSASESTLYRRPQDRPGHPHILTDC